MISYIIAVISPWMSIINGVRFIFNVLRWRSKKQKARRVCESRLVGQVGNMKRMEICEGINLTWVKNERFKTSALSVNFVVPLKRDTASYYALIPHVLKRGSSEHSCMQAITRALNDLYGATIDPFVRKKGENQIIGFMSTFIDSRYLPEEKDQLESVARLVFELMFSPNLENDSFVRASVKSESMNQIDRINAENDDKREYARKRLIEIMCASEPFGINRLGNASDVGRITSRSLYARYLTLMEKSGVEIFYSGPKEINEVAGVIKRVCPLRPRIVLVNETMEKKPPEKPNEVYETMNLSQDKLVMGFRNGTISSDESYPAMMLFNAVFGGSVSSKLFMNVREKLSLCYYASSFLEPRKGIMVVDSGVNGQNVEAAKAEILAQLEACKRGEITDDELESARNTIENHLISLGDSLYRTEDYWISQAVAGLIRSPSDLIAELRALGKEQVAEAARKTVLDTVYHLAGNKEDEVNEI